MNNFSKENIHLTLEINRKLDDLLTGKYNTVYIGNKKLKKVDFEVRSNLCYIMLDGKRFILDKDSDVSRTNVVKDLIDELKRSVEEEKERFIIIKINEMRKGNLSFTIGNVTFTSKKKFLYINGYNTGIIINEHSDEVLTLYIKSVLGQR